MTTNTPLWDRIQARKGTATVTPIGNRRPVWLRRVDEKGFPVKDTTSLVLGAWVPAGEEQGA